MPPCEGVTLKEKHRKDLLVQAVYSEKWMLLQEESTVKHARKCTSANWKWNKFMSGLQQKKRVGGSKMSYIPIHEMYISNCYWYLQKGSFTLEEDNDPNTSQTCSFYSKTKDDSWVTSVVDFPPFNPMTHLWGEHKECKSDEKYISILWKTSDLHICEGSFTLQQDYNPNTVENFVRQQTSPVCNELSNLQPSWRFLVNQKIQGLFTPYVNM